MKSYAYHHALEIRLQSIQIIYSQSIPVLHLVLVFNSTILYQIGHIKTSVPLGIETACHCLVPNYLFFVFSFWIEFSLLD